MTTIRDMRLRLAIEEIEKQRKTKQYKKSRRTPYVVSSMHAIIDGTQRQDKADKL
jgi:hypothetical protein